MMCDVVTNAPVDGSGAVELTSAPHQRSIVILGDANTAPFTGRRHLRVICSSFGSARFKMEDVWFPSV